MQPSGKARRAVSLLIVLGTACLLPSCGDGGSNPMTPPGPPAPTFVNGGVNQEPRAFPAQTLDASFNSSTGFTSFTFIIECPVIVAGEATWRGRVVVREGTPPFTYTMSNGPVGMTINNNGELAYLPPDCSEQGTTKITTFTVSDANGQATTPALRQNFQIVRSN